MRGRAAEETGEAQAVIGLFEDFEKAGVLTFSLDLLLVPCEVLGVGKGVEHRQLDPALALGEDLHARVLEHALVQGFQYLGMFRPDRGEIGLGIAGKLITPGGWPRSPEVGPPRDPDSADSPPPRSPGSGAGPATREWC